MDKNHIQKKKVVTLKNRDFLFCEMNENSQQEFLFAYSLQHQQFTGNAIFTKMRLSGGSSRTREMLQQSCGSVGCGIWLTVAQTRTAGCPWANRLPDRFDSLLETKDVLFISLGYPFIWSLCRQS